jgi:hypothetical protein
MGGVCARSCGEQGRASGARVEMESGRNDEGFAAPPYVRHAASSAYARGLHEHRTDAAPAAGQQRVLPCRLHSINPKKRVHVACGPAQAQRATTPSSTPDGKSATSRTPPTPSASATRPAGRPHRSCAAPALIRAPQLAARVRRAASRTQRPASLLQKDLNVVLALVHVDQRLAWRGQHPVVAQDLRRSRDSQLARRAVCGSSPPCSTLGPSASRPLTAPSRPSALLGPSTSASALIGASTHLLYHSLDVGARHLRGRTRAGHSDQPTKRR